MIRVLTTIGSKAWRFVKSPFANGAIVGAGAVTVGSSAKDAVSSGADKAGNLINTLTGAALVGLVIYLIARKG